MRMGKPAAGFPGAAVGFDSRRASESRGPSRGLRFRASLPGTDGRVRKPPAGGDASGKGAARSVFQI